ncbi:MAG: hypothetical protein J6X38_02285 [Abditibacteriota bacterium]|nr:hypothetical protein [Abditibacteriota bacterium]
MSKRKIGLFALILWAILLCSGALFAATYYVSIDGDDNGAGTEADPWATIVCGDHKGVLQPGDTVSSKRASTLRTRRAITTP